MKRLVIVLTIVGLLMMGCAQPYVPPVQAPVEPPAYTPTGQEPSADKTWMSPGKVAVGNFHLGARAEWPVTIHNGNGVETAFSVQYRLPDNASRGYARAPTDIVQDWVIVTSESPVLAPWETKDILVILEMPEVVDVSEAIFWQVQPEVRERIKVLRQVVYDKYYAEFAAEAEAEGLHEVVYRDDVAVKAQDAAQEWLMADLEGSLLVFLDENGSISTKLFMERGASEELINQFEGKSYITAGDLREGRWEFWISVRDATQTGMVQTELCSRWLISMR